MTRRRRAAAVLALACRAPSAAGPASAHHGAAPPPPQPTAPRRAADPTPPTRPRPPPFTRRHRTPSPAAPGSVTAKVGASRRCSMRSRRARPLGNARSTALGSGARARTAFLSAVYGRDHADFETAHGAAGDRADPQWITLRDPDHKIPFKLINDGHARPAADGRRLRHRVGPRGLPRHAVVRRGVRPLPRCTPTRTGKVLEAPIPLPDVKSPDYPADFPRAARGPGQPRQLGRLRGHGDLARRPHAVPDARGPGRRRRPARRGASTSSTSAAAATPPSAATYLIDDPSSVVSDLYALDDHQLRRRWSATATMGATTVHKQAFAIDLRRATPPARWPSARSSTSSTCATRR